MSLVLHGPCTWWGGTARHATDGAGAARVAVLGAEGADDEALRRARSSSWIGRRAAGVVPLLAIERVDQRLAWVYEDPGGVSLAAWLADRDALPLPLATVVVAACADTLEALAADGIHHPGPAPGDVVIGADGAVALVGFTSPFALDPARREPHGAGDRAAAVWRLGVLLAELIAGPPPAPATERAAHERMIRRLLVKILAQPGPTLPERYRDWVRGLLAWDAEDRPRLARVGPALRELAGADAHAELVARCAEVVPLLRGRGEQPLAARAEPSAPTPIPPPERTAEAGADEPPDEQTELSNPTTEPGDGPTTGAIEQGTLPVHVGPPPEALPGPVRLPSRLFVTDPGADGPPEPTSAEPAPSDAILAALAFLVAAATLVAYLLW